MTEAIIEEQEQEAKGEQEQNPYDVMIEELAQILLVSEQWSMLCSFALSHLQQIYGLWLSTAMAGETIKDRIEIGVKFMPSAMIQKNLIDEAAKQQAEAQAEAQAQFQAQQQKQSGLAVPQGYVRPPTKRGRRGRKQ